MGNSCQKIDADLLGEGYVVGHLMQSLGMSPDVTAVNQLTLHHTGAYVFVDEV
jgi:hypothetical protein